MKLIALEVNVLIERLFLKIIEKLGRAEPRLFGFDIETNWRKVERIPIMLFAQKRY